MHPLPALAGALLAAASFAPAVALGVEPEVNVCPGIEGHHNPCWPASSRSGWLEQGAQEELGRALPGGNGETVRSSLTYALADPAGAVVVQLRRDCGAAAGAWREVDRWPAQATERVDLAFAYHCPGAVQERLDVRAIGGALAYTALTLPG